MAVFGIGIGASFVIALVLGPMIAAASGVRWLFVLGAIVAGIAALLLLALPAGIPQPARSARPALRAVLRPELVRLDLYVFLLHAIVTAIFVALPFMLSDRLELPMADYWKLYVAALLASLVGTVPLIIADDRRGKRGTIRIALILLLLGLAMLAFTSATLLLTLAALAVFFAGFNFLEAGLPSRLSALAQSGQRGASLGVFSSAQFLGAFAGGLAGGALLSGGPPTDVFLMAAVVAGVWIGLHQWGFRGRNRADTPEI